ncbi:MAG: hypothetical protein H6Q51_577 [Deltaproteobacteria bacterium]|jgi:hypothetical protein|nr:hypothetical protein [Deltaproteobacteria bacterium]
MPSVRSVYGPARIQRQISIVAWNSFQHKLLHSRTFCPAKQEWRRTPSFPLLEFWPPPSFRIHDDGSDMPASDRPCAFPCRVGRTPTEKIQSVLRQDQINADT